MGGTYYTDAQPPRLRDLALPAATRRQPGGLVSVGRRGVLAGPLVRPAGARLDRLRGLPLVPRDGAGVVRGPVRGVVDERVVRVHQGRSRGAAGRRRGPPG